LHFDHHRRPFIQDHAARQFPARVHADSRHEVDEQVLGGVRDIRLEIEPERGRLAIDGFPGRAEAGRFQRDRTAGVTQPGDRLSASAAARQTRPASTGRTRSVLPPGCSPQGLRTWPLAKRTFDDKSSPLFSNILTL
jgi:hypothetical protein